MGFVCKSGNHKWQFNSLGNDHLPSKLVVFNFQTKPRRFLPLQLCKKVHPWIRQLKVFSWNMLSSNNSLVSKCFHITIPQEKLCFWIWLWFIFTSKHHPLGLFSRKIWKPWRWCFFPMLSSRAAWDIQPQTVANQSWRAPIYSATASFRGGAEFLRGKAGKDYNM